jgi:hypothetical protein
MAEGEQNFHDAVDAVNETARNAQLPEDDDDEDFRQHELNTALRLREVQRAAIRQQGNMIHDLFAEAVSDGRLIDMETLRDSLAIRMGGLAEHDARVHALLAAGDVHNDANECFTQDLHYRRCITMASNYLAQNRYQAEQRAVQQQAVEAYDARRQVHNATLPRLPLREFSGEIHKFAAWWDLIRSQIHENNNLTDAQRFAYITGLLTGDAEKAVAGIINSATDYDLLITTLQERFGRVRFVRDSYMNELTVEARSPVRDLSDLASLRRHYDTISRLVAQLNNIETPPETYQMAVVPLVLQSLPDKLRMDITKVLDCDENHGNLQVLLAEYLNYIQLRERCDSITNTSKPTTHAANAGSFGRGRGGSSYRGGASHGTPGRGRGGRGAFTNNMRGNVGAGQRSVYAASAQYENRPRTPIKCHLCGDGHTV